MSLVTLRQSKRQFVVWQPAPASTQQKPESATRITDGSENYQPPRPIAGWKENKTLVGYYNNRLSSSLWNQTSKTLPLLTRQRFQKPAAFLCAAVCLRLLPAESYCIFFTQSMHCRDLAPRFDLGEINRELHHCFEQPTWLRFQQQHTRSRPDPFFHLCSSPQTCTKAFNEKAGYCC